VFAIPPIRTRRLDARRETAGLGRVWHRHAANFLWRSHAVWILTQMLAWPALDIGIEVCGVR